MFLFFIAVFASGIVLLFFAGDLKPWVSIGVALAPPLVLLGIRRFPAALIPFVIFIGNFKQKAAEGFDPLDPTLLCLELVFVAVCINLFFFYLQAKGETLRYLFAGQGKAIACFVALELIVALSYLHTINPVYGKTLVEKFLTIGLFLFLVPLLLFRDERDFRQVALMIVALAVPLALYRIYVALTTSSVANMDITGISAGQLIGMTILLIVNYRMTEMRWLQTMIFLTLPLLTVGLIASDARGPALACLGIFCVSVFSKRGAHVFSGKLARVALLLLVIGIVGLAIKKMATTGSQTRVHKKTEELVQLLSGQVPKGTGGERLWAWSAAVSGFVKRPFMGWGAGGSQTYLATHRGLWGLYGGDLNLKYPHNVVLQVAAEQGILGFLAMAGFLWFTFRAVKKIAVDTNGRLSCLQWIFLFDMFAMMFSGDLDDNRAIWLWCSICLAVARMIKVGAISRQISIPLNAGRPARAGRPAYDPVSRSIPHQFSPF